jgi:hypothetical protein
MAYSLCKVADDVFDRLDVVFVFVLYIIFTSFTLIKKYKDFCRQPYAK